MFQECRISFAAGSSVALRHVKARRLRQSVVFSTVVYTDERWSVPKRLIAAH
jgi:hypothetical protein